MQNVAKLHHPPMRGVQAAASPIREPQELGIDLVPYNAADILLRYGEGYSTTANNFKGRPI